LKNLILKRIFKKINFLPKIKIIHSKNHPNPILNSLQEKTFKKHLLRHFPMTVLNKNIKK
jgi:hypothetical protein